MSVLEHVTYEARVATMLTKAPAAPVVACSAIFRVVAAADQFAFTRTSLIGGKRVVEQFGPYGSQRAAHELAQRAAARFRAENVGCIVGVVDLDPADVPAEPAARPLWEVVGEKRREAIRARHREKYAKRASTPEGRERLREKDRRRHARAMATPEGRERIREKWRKQPLARKHPITCTGADDEPPPTCLTCGKTTGFYHGKALSFCPRNVNEKRSACQVKYSNRLRTERVRSDPDLRRKRTQDLREWKLSHPEEARAKARHKYELLRNNPRRWAAKLAAKRGYKSAGGAGSYAADLPTGSVLLTASLRTPGRELLASVYAAVPTNMSPATRMEIISETAALVCEGLQLSEAVKQATKTVRKNAAQLRYTKPIDDCFWLADETAFSLEASL